jgi:hypothetical protein
VEELGLMKMLMGTYRQMLLLVNLFSEVDAGIETRDEEPEVYECFKLRSSPVSRDKGMNDAWYTGGS